MLGYEKQDCALRGSPDPTLNGGRLLREGRPAERTILLN